MEKKLIWETSTEYDRHRIPGIITTSKGTIIIYNEARKSLSDWALMDIFMLRSQDGGKTFGNRIYLAKGNEKYKTVNNPVMVEDKCGTLHFLYCENYGINGGRVLQKISLDDGITWSEGEDISKSTKKKIRNVFALGPGHGICKEDNTLIIPCWYVKKKENVKLESHVPSVNAVLYSKDNGKSWKLSREIICDEDSPSPSEASICETSDGGTYLNSRVNRANDKCRCISYSKTGYSNFSKYIPDFNLLDPVCFGSCISFKYCEKHYIVFANCNNENERKNVSLKLSCDNGLTWNREFLIDKDNGGYVDLSYDAINKKIYVLYEIEFGKMMNFCIVDIDELIY